MLLSAHNVTKKYGGKTVLHNISVDLEEGSILGLVGRNGSGKTVLLKCLSGLVPPTSGEIYYRGKRLGKDIEMPEDMGVLIESPGLLTQYDGLSNLSLYMNLRRKPDRKYLRGLMETVGLDPDNRTKAGRYSLGMKQRLGIAMALMDDPAFLILDEPMNGLDSAGVAEIRRLLIGLKEKGVSMVLASHIVGDIQQLCDHVLFLENGEAFRYDDTILRNVRHAGGTQLRDS